MSERSRPAVSIRWPSRRGRAVALAVPGDGGARCAKSLLSIAHDYRAEPPFESLLEHFGGLRGLHRASLAEPNGTFFLAPQPARDFTSPGNSNELDPRLPAARFRTAFASVSRSAGHFASPYM